jgi:hypothetical protein
MSMKCFLLGLALLGSATHASAIILIDRGLPASTNVNIDAGANRSNIDWANITIGSDRFINGDSFVAGNWIIDAITVWAVGSSSTAFTDYQLYTSVNGGTFAPLAAVPTVTTTTYQPAGVSFQNGDGSFYPIIQLRFSGLNLSVNAGDLFYFAPDASGGGTCTEADPSGCFFVHATNAGLADAIQEQSNDRYINFLLSVANGDPLECDSGAPISSGTCDGGWDKSSDINVLVEGRLADSNDIPEPTTVVLMTLGLGAMAFLRRRS